jgi:hypothetical protein
MTASNLHIEKMGHAPFVPFRWKIENYMTAGANQLLLDAKCFACGFLVRVKTVQERFLGLKSSAARRMSAPISGKCVRFIYWNILAVRGFARRCFCFCF